MSGSEWAECPVILPEEERRFMGWDVGEGPADIRSYESLLDCYDAAPPKRAVFLPIKTPVRPGAQSPHKDVVANYLALGEVLGSWLDRGSHLLFVVPSRDRVAAGQNEVVLRNRVGELITEATPDCSTVSMETSALGVVRCRPSGAETEATACVGSGQSAVVFRDSSGLAVDLARNAVGASAAISLPASGGRVSIVPRSLLDGPLRLHRTAYPYSLNLELLADERPKKGSVGIVRVNGEPLEFREDHYEYIKTLWHSSWARRLGKRHVDWSDSLKHDKHEIVGNTVRKRLEAIGLTLVLKGGSGASASLSPRVVPPEFELQGWEKPDVPWPGS